MKLPAETSIRFNKKEKKDFISVIVPVYRDVSGLEDTLKSLASQSYPSDKFEVLVANDGGDPEISDVCDKYQVTEVGSKTNKGSYFARNLAMEFSQGEYLVFTDADVQVPADWLKYINKYFTQGADYIGGDVVIDPTKIRTLTNKLTAQYEFKNKDIFQTLHFTPTANVAVRRAVIEELGGFDRRLFSSGDYEFGDRVYRSGKYKQVFAENIAVIHPPRGYTAFLKKLERISGGHRDLATYYPDRFGTFRKPIHTEVLEAMCVPSFATTNFGERILMTVLLIRFQMHRAYHNIRNNSRL